MNTFNNTNLNFFEYNYEYNFLLNFMNLSFNTQLVFVILYIVKKYCIQYVYEYFYNLYISYTSLHCISVCIRSNLDLIYELLENNNEYKMKTTIINGLVYKFVNINKLHYIKKYNCYIKSNSTDPSLFYDILSYNLNDLKKLVEYIHINENNIAIKTSCKYWKIDKNLTQNISDSYCWTIKNVNINDLFFEEKDKIINVLDDYIKNDKQIGILLIGEPGLGKTTLINAINSYIKCDIYNIKNVSVKMIENIYYNSKNKIILYEEFDCKDLNINFTRKIKYYKDLDYSKISKDNIDIITEHNNKNKQIELGEFLECLDGILTKKNISIFTTNNEDIHLDPALIRPGRIDYIINLKRLRVIDINNYFKKKFNEDIPEKIYKNMNDYIYRLCDVHKLLNLEKDNTNDTNIDEYYFNYKIKNSKIHKSMIFDDDESLCSETNYSEN